MAEQPATVETIFNETKLGSTHNPSSNTHARDKEGEHALLHRAVGLTDPPPSSSFASASCSSSSRAPTPTISGGSTSTNNNLPFNTIVPATSSTSISDADTISTIVPIPRRRDGSFTTSKLRSKPLRRRSNSLGEFNEPSTKRLLIDLISTLNESFPDYDFGKTKADQFVLQNTTKVVSNVNSHFGELTMQQGGERFLDDLWATIDEVVSLRKSEVYSYVSDMDGDPFSDGSLWSFNYFFFNADMQQICYFTCVARSKFNAQRALMSPSRYDSQDDDYRSESESNAYDVDQFAGSDDDDCD